MHAFECLVWRNMAEVYAFVLFRISNDVRNNSYTELHFRKNQSFMILFIAAIQMSRDTG